MSKRIYAVVSSALFLVTACSFPFVSFDDAASSSAGGAVGATSTIASTAAISTADATASGTGGSPPVPGVPVDLGTASDYAILAESGITNVPPSVIQGDMGVSPIAVTAITGFALVPDANGQFSTSLQVDGKVYAASHMAPTPAKLGGAVADMLQAFGAAAARPPDVTEMELGDIGGATLVPGVYRWSSGVSITTSVTLEGNATDVFVFQIAQTLELSGASQVILTGGVVPRNVFWQVSGLVDIGAASHLEGIVLGKTSIAMHAGASTNGRLLAQTAVNLETAFVTPPDP